MKPRYQSICVVLAIVGISCSARLPAIVQDMRSATGREEQVRIFNRIATNAQERSELFAYMDARPDSVAAAKSKLLTFYADQTNKPAQLPAPLDMSPISAPHQTCEGLNYTFSSPWPDLVESKESEGQWVVFQDPNGRVIMLSKAIATNTFDDFVLSELSSSPNDYTWIKAFAFPDHTNDQGAAFYRQCLNATPDVMSECKTIEGVFQYHARIMIKLILLGSMTSPIINEVRTGVFDGFQIRDASKPGRYHIRMFDNFGELIELVFGFKKGSEALISQADVNCVLLSLKKIDAEQSVAGYPPQSVGSPEP